MHICDGILDPKICIGGYVAAGCLTAVVLAKTRQEDVPKIAVMSAAFFVSSLIHFRIGFSSVHLTFLGLVSIILGIHAPLAITVGLFFQAVMFQHGGLSTLGVNSFIFSTAALLIYGLYTIITKPVKNNLLVSISAGVVTVIGIFSALAAILFLIYFSGEEFAGFAYIFSVANGMLALVEGVVTSLAVYYILKTKPRMLGARHN